jgi:hypothetical protein
MNRWLTCLLLVASLAWGEKVDCKAFAKDQQLNCERICSEMATRQKKKAMAAQCQKTCKTQAAMAEKSCVQQR